MVRHVVERPIDRSAFESGSARIRKYVGNETIALVGFFGAGKRTLGVIAALALKRRFIDFDKFFQQQIGLRPVEYIAAYGPEAYRKTELDTFNDILTKHREQCVISGIGGMGSSALGQALRSFARTNPVIYVRREKEELIGYVGTGREKFEQIYEIANRFFESCSNFDFFNLTQSDSHQESFSTTLKLKDTERDFTRFLNQIYGREQVLLRSVDPLSPKFTYALQTSADWLEDKSNNYEELDRGADAVNLTVSTSADNINNIQYRLAKHMATIRRHCRQPIIFDIDTHSSLSPQHYVDSLRAIFRQAPDLITIPLSTNISLLNIATAEKGQSKLIGTHHESEMQIERWIELSWPAAVAKAEQLQCSAIRVSFEPDAGQDVRKWLVSSSRFAESTTIPISCYMTGAEGRTSICLNETLSPVMPDSAIARLNPWPHMTLSQAQSSLHSIYLMPKRTFAILGQSVSYSLSPAMHNAAYQACGLPHQYSFLQTDEFTNIQNLLKDETCGGVAVSLPYKSDVLALLDTISSDAADIGAVNTVVVRRIHARNAKISLHGYNTDYLGIRECIARSLSPANTIREGSTALIIGAGGMARAAVYACHKLNVEEVVVYNRTISRAQDLANYFNTWAKNQPITKFNVSTLASTQDDWPSNLRQPTVIMSCIPAHSIGGQPVPNLKLPDQWIQSRTGGVVIELAYKPLITALIKQMRSRSEMGWITVDGLHVLVEQGIAQYELFTGRPAPVHVMRRAVREQYNRIISMSEHDTASG